MKYFATIARTTQTKNRAEKQVFDYVKDLDHTLIMDDIDLRQFVRMIEEHVRHINATNPRSRDISFSYREYDNEFFAAIYIGEFLYINIYYVKNQSSPDSEKYKLEN